MANNLPQSNLLAFSIPVPPLAEQVDIADFLEAECRKLDALRAEAECVIALLRERGSALITAAVTGQIDVRGVVCPASNPQPPVSASLSAQPAASATPS